MEIGEFIVKDSVEATAQSTALTDREKHLIGLAVTATRGCIACTGGRLEKALAAGIEYESVRAAIDLAAAVNAGYALSSLDRSWAKVAPLESGQTAGLLP